MTGCACLQFSLSGNSLVGMQQYRGGSITRGVSVPEY